ncbi:YbbR-like domain-containing protein [Sporosarcina cyprini]|uniref:CdaR family protein n=1 Tax=Sporosarcina cyprini TaxID=2910523 RepID=UPI001EE0B2DA|nr:CdaR family protein [Sporosarcina cyprini]MCG3089859.1 CdaR family protein [Sporosarcina cyprini]
MDNLFDRPWFLRFTALALAVFFFFTVQAEEENKSSMMIGDTLDILRDVPVEVYYDTENLVVTGVPETVNMKIEGPANIVQSTKLLRDFSLKVDLRDRTIGEHKVQIQTENLSDKLKVTLDPATVDVKIEEKITQSFRVDPELNERLLAEDYNVVKMEVEPSSIEVTGAKSVIESISFVKVSATKEKGIDKSFEQKARVRVLDRELNKLNVTMSPEEVTVKVQIEQNHKEVPIVLKQKGTPADGITINSITSDAKEVKLYGPRAALEPIKELAVNVDVADIKESGTYEVTLPKPKGVKNVSSEKIKVTINVTKDANSDESPPEASVEPEAEPETETTVQMKVTKKFSNVPIEIRGLQQQYKSTFSKPLNGLVDVTVTADQDVINSLKTSDFNLFIDTSKVNAEGEQTFPIQAEMPDAIAWKLSDEEVTLEIVLA